MTAIKFDRYAPTAALRPYIQQLVVAENAHESAYKVFPTTGLVIGFQYQGHLATLHDGQAQKLATAGITGITDSYKVFRNSSGIGTVLVYFTEVGFTHFSTTPAHELMHLSISLDLLFAASEVRAVEEQLAAAGSDRQRIDIVERFLLSQVRALHADRLVLQAVHLIHQSQGAIRIRELAARLAISQSPFEKRFRRVVGASPKKFASIVRFNAVLAGLQAGESLADICFAHNFFDQAHLTKDFKQYTGDTPEQFRRDQQKNDFLQSEGG